MIRYVMEHANLFFVEQTTHRQDYRESVPDSKI